VTFDEVLAHFPGARALGDGKAEARCGAHEDQRASLSISRGTDGRTVMHCHAGCETRDVLAAVGLAERDLFADERPAAKARIVATYRYVDAAGTLRYEVTRWEPKSFRPRRPGPDGKPIWNLAGVERIPYRLPEVLAASAEAPIYIVEGEKDADALGALGIVATTNPGGCGSTKLWNTPPFRDPFVGRDVVIIPDKDEPGAKHAAHVTKALATVAKSVKVLRLPAKDAADWLAGGHTADELRALVVVAPEGAQIVDEPEPAVEVVPPGQRRNPRDYARTETGAAELFADIYRGSLYYVPELRAWRRWTGTHWASVVDGVEVLEMTKAVSAAFLGEAQWALKADDARAKDLAQFAIATQRLYTRKAILELARSEPGMAMPVGSFDRDGYLLNFANVTVQLRDGVARKHDPADLLTVVVACDYDAAASCPRWESFLREVLPDLETVEFVRRAIGYTATADISEHVLFSCFGAGANGKSVLLNTLLHVLGPYATTAPTSMLVAKQHESHPAEKVVLEPPRRMAVFQEIPSGQRLNESAAKALVSGDPDQARGMRENFRSFRPQVKLWLAGNNRLDIREQTEGIWRRYREIPFERVIPENQRDHKLEEKLREEAPGIAAWIVQACLDWQRAGLGNCQKVSAATADYRAEADVLAPFLDDRCVLGVSAVARRAAVFREYLDFCEHLKVHPMSDKRFAELMRGRGFRVTSARVEGKPTKVWIGLRLASGQDQTLPLIPIPKESPYSPHGNSLHEEKGEKPSESVTPVTPGQTGLPMLATEGEAF